MLLLSITAAALIGAACTWPALYLYEHVLKAMAFLQDRESSYEGLSIWILTARYALGISWMAFAFVVFIGLPMYFFPANHYLQPVDSYIMSFCVVFFLRYLPFNRRMRTLGIAPEQRVRPGKWFP